MALGDPDDVLRSLRRYVWLMLGGIDPVNGQRWRVRTERARIEDDARPVAVVEESAPMSTPHARTRMLQQGDVQKAITYTVMAYPVLMPSSAESRQEAARIRTLLDAGFTRGLIVEDDNVNPPTLTHVGAPFAFPVYDFAGVPVVGDAGLRSGPADPYMHADIDNTFSVRPVQDAQDELRWSVVATLRVSWWAPGRVPDTRPRVAGVPGSWTPSGPLPEVWPYDRPIGEGVV